MHELISYCGLVCTSCPIFVATRMSSPEEQARARREIYRVCTEQYKMEITLDDITDCDGCRTEGGRLFSGCKACGIRPCAREKNLESCALCPSFVCEKLETFLASEPSAKIRLEEIRLKVNESPPSNEGEVFINV